MERIGDWMRGGLRGHLNGGGGDLTRLIEIQREDLREARGVGVEAGAAVSERLQQQEDGIQFLHWSIHQRRGRPRVKRELIRISKDRPCPTWLEAITIEPFRPLLVIKPE